MQVGVASVWRWLRWASAQHSRYDGTPGRFVPAGGQIEWVGLLLVATASVILFGGVEVRHLAPLELFLFVLAGLAALRRWQLDADFPIHPLPVDEQRFEAGDFALYRNVRREGVVL